MIILSKLDLYIVWIEHKMFNAALEYTDECVLHLFCLSKSGKSLVCGFVSHR